MCECGHQKYHHHQLYGRCLQTKRALNGMDWCGCSMYRRVAQPVSEEARHE